LPWFHNCVLIDKPKDAEARQWCALAATENGCSHGSKIVDGSRPTSGRDPVRGLHACRFNRSEIDLLIRASMPEDAPIPVHVPAARLMWPPEIVGHYIDRGIVAPEHINADRKGRSITREGCAHLASLCGSAGQLGRERGISAAMVRKLLTEAGIQPVIPPHGINRVSFYLFDRDDADDVLGPPRKIGQ
jgi:hypothetical protein